MSKWIKAGRTVNSEGTTIIYQYIGTPYSIESRKRHIPHANGIGTWDHTFFVVKKGDYEISTKHSLADAKEYVQREVDA